MCGRYFFQMEDNLPQIQNLKALLNEHEIFDFRQGEVFPSQDALVLKKADSKRITPEVMKWGFDGYKGKRLINARSEGIEEKMTFRPILHNRCVICANGFYEWVAHGAKKDKIYIQKANSPLFYMAGLYNPHGEFVIVTGPSSNEMASIHGRTPIMMNEVEMVAYLQKERSFIVDNDDLIFQKV